MPSGICYDGLMHVSVLLPTYNRADLLEETIASLLKQSRRPDDILIIDDGSTDGTRERVAAFGPAVSYVFQQNRGKAAALNHGLRLSRGDVIWICDDDDILLPEACRLMSEGLEADPDLDFIAGRYLDFRRDPKTGRIVFSDPGYSPRSRPEEIFPDLLEGCHIFQPGLMVRRRAYDQTGAFNEGLVRSQDYDMILRLARHHAGRVLDETVFHHRVHSGARGSGAQRFAWRDADAVWIAHNRQILGPLVETLQDEAVLPQHMVRGLDRAAAGRMAGLKRATILARAQMWDEAVEHWSRLAGGDQRPLSPPEGDLIQRATGHAFGCADLLRRRDLRVALRRMARQSPLGGAMAGQIRRSLRWRLRYAFLRGRWPDMARILRFWARVR